MLLLVRIYIVDSTSVFLSVLNTDQTMCKFIYWVDILSTNNFSFTLTSQHWKNISENHRIIKYADMEGTIKITDPAPDLAQDTPKITPCA